MNPAEVSLSKTGATLQLEAEVKSRRGENCPDAKITYRSRTPSVAKVSSTGLVTAVGHGTTMLDILVPGTDVMEFVRVVVRLPEKVDVRPSATQCNIGGLKKLSAKVLDPDGEQIPNIHIDWSSSNEKLARVDERGEVVGLDEGEVEIYAEGMGLKGTSKVRITWAPGQKAMIEAERRFQERSKRARGGGRKKSGPAAGGSHAGDDPRLSIFAD